MKLQEESHDQNFICHGNRLHIGGEFPQVISVNAQLPQKASSRRGEISNRWPEIHFGLLPKAEYTAVPLAWAGILRGGMQGGTERPASRRHPCILTGWRCSEFRVIGDEQLPHTCRSRAPRP